MKRVILISTAILVTLLQLCYFRFVAPWGDGLAPLYIPAAVTFIYAVLAREGILSFITGFFSLMAMFGAPMWFEMELPPSDALLPMLGWAVAFGLFGLSISWLTRRITAKKGR